MYVTRASIENVRIISRFDLNLSRFDDPAGWHVILGDNGAGKSTVVRSIAIALVGSENASALRQDWSDWLVSAKQTGMISLNIRADAKQDKWTGTGRQATKPIRTQVSFSRDLFDLGPVEANFTHDYAHRSVWGNGTGWFSAAFGPFRRFRGGDHKYEKLYHSHPRLAAHLSAFGEDVALSEALDWIRNNQFRALEGDATAKRLIDGLKVFVNGSGLLPHGAHIEEVTSQGVMIDNGTGTQVTVEEMSDGYRSVLSMAFELIRSMDAAYGTETLLAALDPENGRIDLPGVVLIDEVDAHLHPAWQKRIGTWFTDRFPKMQFFVTTHSPIICQAARKGSIWRLATPGSDEKSGRVTGQDFERLVNGNILDAYSTEYFGVGVTRSEDSKDMMRLLAELNRKSMTAPLTKEEERERERLQSAMPSRASSVEA